jgi:glycerophosphoryl diester phosphodiesterase
VTPALPAAFLRRPLAHRGLHDRSEGRVENSRAAVTSAIAAGYGIEIDVQLTADDTALVFHDDTLDRLTGASGPVRAQPLCDLQRLPLRDSSEAPPTLAEIVELVAGRAALLVELKDQSGHLGPEPDTLAAAVVRAIAGYKGPIALMSFNPHIVQHLARLAPETPRGLTTMDFSDVDGLESAQRRHLNAIDTFDAVGASFVSHDRCSLDAAALVPLRARGCPVLTWTIRSPDEARAAAALSDNITFEGFRPPVAVPQG